MKATEIVSICLRFFAVTLVLSSFATFFVSLQQIQALAVSGAPSRGMLMLGGTMVLFLWAIALFLWLYPTWLAELIVPNSIDSVFQAGFTAKQLEVVLLSILGVWVLVGVVPSLAQLGLWFVAQTKARGDLDAGWQSLVRYIFQIAIGTFLVLRSVGIRRVLNRLRSRGLGPTEH